MRLDAPPEEFLTYCANERRLAALTVEAYRADLLDLHRFAGGVATIGLGVDDLKRYLVDLNETRRLSVATIKRRFATLQGFFRWAAREKGVTNPLLQWTPRLKRPRRLPKALSRVELGSLIVHAERRAARSMRAEPTRLALVLLSCTGLRVGELCALTIESVSADGQAIRVLGKGARDRIVYVSNKAVRDALRALRRERSRTCSMDDLLFLNAGGGALTPAALRGRFKRLNRAAGASRRLTPHMLRHTAATLMVEQGVDIRYVQKLLGHSSIATTEIYTHVADAALKRTLDRADVLGSVTGTTRKRVQKAA